MKKSIVDSTTPILGERADNADPVGHRRQLFDIPDGLIYLDGNSLGLMPKSVPGRLAHVVEQEWGTDNISSWRAAGWLDLPATVGDRIAPLIGVGSGEVVVGDSTTVNLFKCVAAALQMRPGRSIILVEQRNFPTDNYICEGLATSRPGTAIRHLGANEPVEAGLDSDVAVFVLSHIDYQTAAMRDMEAINALAHERGALVLWDLSHSTGAVDVDLTKTQSDFAVGCTYKYLNGGPGAPAYVWAGEHLVNESVQPLAGWMGHADPFAFSSKYVPAAGIRRFISGTPQILSLTALDESLKVWNQVDRQGLYEKSRRMSDFFIDAVESRCSGLGVVLQSPRDADRGSHVSFGVRNASGVMAALAERKIIGDFRPPSTLRFAITPLYVTYADLECAAEALSDVLRSADG